MREKLDMNQCRRGGARINKQPLIMKKKFIPIYLLLVGLVILGFINPDGIRGAWANNVWSLSFIERYFEKEFEFSGINNPPSTHKHAGLYLIKQAIRQKNYALAIKYLEPMITESDPIALETYASILYLQESYPEAIEVWKGLKNEPQLVRLHVEFRAKGDFETSLLSYKALYEIYPEKYTYMYAALMFAFFSDNEGAVAILDRSIQDFPGSEKQNEWFNLKGEIFTQIKEFSKAEAAFKQALVLDSDDWQTWSNLGLLYFRMKEYPKQISSLQKVIELVPTKSTGYFDIAYAYLLNEQYNQAVIAIEKALEIDSGNLNIVLRAGFIYEQNQLNEKALEAYQSALTLDPENKEAAQGVSRLLTKSKP